MKRLILTLILNLCLACVAMTAWPQNLMLNQEEPSAKDCIKPHKGDNNIWYFDTEVYQMEGIGRFYLGLANHIKILNAHELEKFIAFFVKENLQK